MDSVVAFAVFGVDWEFFKPYIVLGLALGGVYALSGVGIVVLYQATGVLNLAFGAIGILALPARARTHCRPPRPIVGAL